jgi:hypothetical protein
MGNKPIPTGGDILTILKTGAADTKSKKRLEVIWINSIWQTEAQSNAAKTIAASFGRR